MLELLVNIEEDWFDALKEQVGVSKAEIVRDAFTVYKWAADERAAGRYIISMDEKGDDQKRLFVPSLEAAAIRKKKAA